MIVESGRAVNLKIEQTLATSCSFKKLKEVTILHTRRIGSQKRALVFRVIVYFVAATDTDKSYFEKHFS